MNIGQQSNDHYHHCSMHYNNVLGKIRTTLSHASQLLSSSWESLPFFFFFFVFLHFPQLLFLTNVFPTSSTTPPTPPTRYFFKVEEQGFLFFYFPRFLCYIPCFLKKVQVFLSINLFDQTLSLLSDSSLPLSLSLFTFCLLLLCWGGMRKTEILWRKVCVHLSDVRHESDPKCSQYPIDSRSMHLDSFPRPQVEMSLRDTENGKLQEHFYNHKNNNKNNKSTTRQ